MPQPSEHSSDPRVCVFTPSPVKQPRSRVSQSSEPCLVHEDELISSPPMIFTQYSDGNCDVGPQDAYQSSQQSEDGHENSVYSVAPTQEMNVDEAVQQEKSSTEDSTVDILRVPRQVVVPLEGNDSPTDSDSSFEPADHAHLFDEGASNASSLPSSQAIITENEVTALHDTREDFISTMAPQWISNTMEERTTVTEDFWSCLFAEPCDFLQEHSLEGNYTNDEHIHDVSEERQSTHQVGGLKGWKYAGAFEDVSIGIDNADSLLGRRFLTESNKMLDNVVEEIKVNGQSSGQMDHTALTRMAVFDVFLPTFVLEKLRVYVNRVLSKRSRPTATLLELKGVIVTHVLAASYGTSVSIMTSCENHEFYFQTGICGDRYIEIWSALNGTTERRQRVQEYGLGWSNKPIAGNQLITELEQELSAINRRFLYIPGQTVFSLDDDHQRLSSRAVTELTTLAHINNPQKALGSVNNALCSALSSAFLACHFSRPGEKTIHVWERLVQLVQGSATPGSLTAMTDAIFAADRGYNSRETIDFINDRLGATGIGTHKRSLDYPFVFGDGLIRKRHKGMVVGEKGCRAVYSAVRRPTAKAGKEIQAIVYRESYSGRIASVYHNNMPLFGANLFTSIPKTEFIGRSLEPECVERRHEIYCPRPEKEAACEDETVEGAVQCHRTGDVASVRLGLALNQIEEYTILQSEDPGWFLARAFQFTSRTTHGFFRAFASDFNNHLKSSAELLCGRSPTFGAHALPNDKCAAQNLLRSKWTGVLEGLGMKQRNPAPDIDGSEAISNVMSATETSLQSLRKDVLVSILVKVGHQPASSATRPVLKAKILQLKKDVSEGLIELVPVTATAPTIQELTTALRKSLYEASLDAWFMKPLTATAGMKEGSFNEQKVLKSLPRFFENCRVTCSIAFQTGTHMRSQYESKHTIHRIRTIGLIGSRSIRLLAGSPDGIVVFSKAGEHNTVAAVEIKTMTSLQTIKEAETVRDRYSPLNLVGNIGGSEYSLDVFHQMVPSTEYRLQCIHHAAVFGKHTVLFVVAKGSNLGVGNIIYAVILEFTAGFIADYCYCLSSLREIGFQWIGQDATRILEAYDELLLSHFATDLYSFGSFYNLSRAYKILCQQKGPLPPARMIRPSCLVFWNLLKGGVDEFSRNMQNLCYTNSSENPIVSVVGRLLCAQVNNVGVIYRLSIAKKKGRLPDAAKDIPLSKSSYRMHRHNVSRSMTFSSFAKHLAKEFAVMYRHHKDVSSSANIGSSKVLENETVKQMYVKNVVQKYNRKIDARRRLSGSRLYKLVKGKSAYCSLCSFNYSLKLRGRVFKKKGGSKIRQWCGLCCQPICPKCWDKWHSVRTLVKGQISEKELIELKERAESELQES